MTSGEDPAGDPATRPLALPRRRPLRRAENIYDLPSIPGYRLEGVLGTGATGTVYSAIQEAVDRPVAIKFLHPELCTNPRTIARLQREARVTARLGHPGIVTAIDMGETAGRWWYAMELVEGISLGERVAERGPLGEREAIRLFVPLVDALRHCHEMGVVHRDVKPANILVDESGRARLADLGLAWAEVDPRVTGEDGALGTPHYMSPEHAKDAASVDQRSDLWSLGATLFHALTGRPPFVGRSAAEVLAGVLHQRIPDPRSLAPHLSRGMALVLRKCLTREPGKRYPDALALLKDLERLRERRAPRVRAADLDPVASGQGRPWLAGLKAAALIAVGAGAVLAWRGWGTPASPAGAAEPWPPLEQLAADLAGAEVPLRELDERLTLMQRGGSEAALPADQRPRAGELRLLWGERLAAEVAAGLGALEARLGVALERADLRLATRVLEEEWPADLEARTGYRLPEQWPPSFTGAGAARARLDSQRERVRAAGAAWVESASRALERHRSEVRLPGALRLAEAGSYRSALASLGAPEVEWLGLAGVDRSAVPVELVDEALSSPALEAALASDREYLRSRWRSEDAELVARVLGEEQRALSELVGGRLGVLEAFERAWDELLAERGIRQEEVPEGEAWRSFAVHARVLERLRTEQADERVLRSRSLYEDDLARVEELARDRRYADAVLLWEAELAAPLLSSVHPEIEDRLHEARACASAVAAATALLERGGTRTLSLRGLEARGAVEPLGEQGGGAFLLRVGGEAQGFAVRRTADGVDLPLLPVQDLVTLVDEASGTPPGEPSWFVPVLLLLAEGEAQAARQRLAASPPEAAEAAHLVALRERVRLEAEVRSAALARERDRFLVRLQGLRQELLAGVPPAELGQRLEALARAFDGVLGDEQSAALEALRRELSPGPAPVAPAAGAQAFEAAVREQLPDGRLRLTLDPTLSSGAGWEPGLWRARPGGLTLAAPLPGRTAFEARAGAAVLDLGTLFDPAGGLRLRWVLERLEPFQEETLVALSAGDRHLVLRGQDADPEVRLLTGPLPQAWAGLDPGASTPRGRFDGLPRTQPLELEALLEPGTLAVEELRIDGRKVPLSGRRSSVEAPGTLELAIRSLGPMRVTRLVVEGVLALRTPAEGTSRAADR